MQPCRQANKQKCKKIDRQTNREEKQTRRKPGRHERGLISKEASHGRDKHSERQRNRKSNRQAGRQKDRQTDQTNK